MIANVIYIDILILIYLNRYLPKGFFRIYLQQFEILLKNAISIYKKKITTIYNYK